MINENSIISTLRNAIRSSNRNEAYATALSSIKDTASLSQFLTHLSNNVESHKLPKEEPTSHSGNMARLRGGRFGNSRNQNPRRNSRRPQQNSNDNSKTYVTGRNPKDGKKVVGKVIKERPVNQPCFHMFTKGKCNRKDCAYNHNFEVIDLTDGKDDNDEKHVESQTNENPSASVNLAAEVPLDNENDNPSSENDDGFHADFAHDSGFQCNLAMMSTDDLQLTPANDLRPTLVSSFFSFLLTILSVCLLPVTLLLTTTYVCTTALLSLLYCVLCSTFYIFCVLADNIHILNCSSTIKRCYVPTIQVIYKFTKCCK